MRIRITGNIFLIAVLSITGCKKNGFLEAKPDQSVTVPASVADCQALLDNDGVMNGYGNAGYGSLGETGTDDYYVTSAQYQAYSSEYQQAVVWAKQIYDGSEVDDWNLPYRTVFYANTVIKALSEMQHITESQLNAYNKAMGGALFFRSFAFYDLSQIFAPAYDSSTSSKDWGIPLVTDPDVNAKIVRSTVKETYDRIIGDLVQAAPLLPVNMEYPTRPSRAAVYGLLSRIYLGAGDFTDARLYADSCLQLHPQLMDYNQIDATPVFPFSRTNTEIIFGAARLRQGPLASLRSMTDSTLFSSYSAGDQRRTLYFKNGRYYVGTYDESGYPFCGIATDEIILNRAECYARAGNPSAAITDLNRLLMTRWATGAYPPLTAGDAAGALTIVLAERKKQLLYRGTRWTDLRRLNKHSETAQTLTRTVNGRTYTLPPGDPRYVYAIPNKVIASNKNMPQNPR